MLYSFIFLLYLFVDTHLLTNNPKTETENKQAPQGLEGVFHSFAHGAQDMDGVQFAKLTRDIELLDDNLNSTDVDLIFAKVKGNSSVRKITFEQFQEALEQLAEKKGVSKEDLAGKIEQAGGPHFHGTVPDNVRLHDDKSTYTGVYAHGGPSVVDQKNQVVPDY